VIVSLGILGSSHALAHFCMQILLKTEFKAMKYKPCSACTCDIPNENDNEIANKSNSRAGVGLALSFLHPYPQPLHACVSYQVLGQVLGQALEQALLRP
jgi:hypothetical protein